MSFIRYVGLFLLSFLFLTAEEGAPLDLMPKLKTAFPEGIKKLRINTLWPSNYAVCLSIEPAIPQNFVLRVIQHTDEGEGCFVWGEKEFLDTNDFKILESLTQSVLVFRCSMGVAQTGPEKFFNFDQLVKSFEELGAKKIAQQKAICGGDTLCAR